MQRTEENLRTALGLGDVQIKTLLHDNDLMFNTTNSETLHEIAKTWRVRWLVASPDTDIALPKPLPAWLVEQQNCGDLRIYRID